MRINLNLDAKELLKYIDRPYDEAEVAELISEIKPSLGYKVLPVSRLASSRASFTRCASPPDKVVADCPRRI